MIICRVHPSGDDVDPYVDRLAGEETSCRPHYDTFSLVYDKWAAKYYRDKVSVATFTGRDKSEYDLSEDPEGTPHGEYLLNDDYEFATSTVHYDSDAEAFYLHAAMER